MSSNYANGGGIEPNLSSNITEYPSHHLEMPRLTVYSVMSLYNQIRDGVVDVNQKDVVWIEAKQSKIIDSIFKNFHIPPIVFAVTTDGIKTCVDGTQRLMSVQKFMDGLIPCIDSITNEKLWYKLTEPKLNGRVISANARQIFDDKGIICVEYTTLSSAEERDMCLRLNGGWDLTSAEVENDDTINVEDTVPDENSN